MIGAAVAYHTPDFPDEEIGYVIGEPHYSVDGSHVVVSTQEVHGMPLASRFCRVISPRCDVADLRERYDRLYPGFLKPLPAKESEK